MLYPKHFPDNCPPSLSNIASGEFYRLINKAHKIPQRKDFLSWREEFIHKDCPASLSECQVCGVSIHASLDDIENLSLRIPRLKNKKIAKGILSDGPGKIKHTPTNNEKSHHTWWIPENTEPHEFFRFIDTNKEDSNKT